MLLPLFSIIFFSKLRPFPHVAAFVKHILMLDWFTVF